MIYEDSGIHRIKMCNVYITLKSLYHIGFIMLGSHLCESCTLRLCGTAGRSFEWASVPVGNAVGKSLTLVPKRTRRAATWNSVVLQHHAGPCTRKWMAPRASDKEQRILGTGTHVIYICSQTRINVNLDLDKVHYIEYIHITPVPTLEEFTI